MAFANQSHLIIVCTHHSLLMNGSHLSLCHPVKQLSAFQSSVSLESFCQTERPTAACDGAVQTLPVWRIIIKKEVWAASNLHFLHSEYLL